MIKQNVITHPEIEVTKRSNEPALPNITPKIMENPTLPPNIINAVKSPHFGIYSN